MAAPGPAQPPTPRSADGASLLRAMLQLRERLDLACRETAQLVQRSREIIDNSQRYRDEIHSRNAADLEEQRAPLLLPRFPLSLTAHTSSRPLDPETV